MKTASKILSMLLLVAMCLSLMGGSAYADDIIIDDGNNLIIDGSGAQKKASIPSNDEDNIIIDNSGNSDNNNSKDPPATQPEIIIDDQEIKSNLMDVMPMSAIGNVWQVNGKDYSTMGKGVEHAGNGTLLLKDNTKLDGETDNKVTITQNMTIDLGGKTLELGSTNISIIGCTVTFTNGTVSTTGTGRIVVESGATLINNAGIGSGSIIQNGTVDVTDDWVAMVGTIKYKTEIEAFTAAAAAGGATIDFNPDISKAKDFVLEGFTASGGTYTLNLASNRLILKNCNFSGCTLNVYGTDGGSFLKSADSGPSTFNGTKIYLGTGVDLEGANFTLTGANAKLTVNGGDVNALTLNEGAGLYMASGTVKSLTAGTNAVLTVSGGTVENFTTTNNLSTNRGVTGGKWKLADNQLERLKSAVPDTHEVVGPDSNGYYTVQLKGSSGGTTPGDSYVLYGSPYTRNSSGSVYVDFTIASTNGNYYYKPANGNITALSSGQYSVSGISNGYNYRLTLSNSFLNGLANGSYTLYRASGINDKGMTVATQMGTFVIQGSGTNIPSGDAYIYPTYESTWFSGNGTYYFTVIPDLKLVAGSNYSYYDVRIDGKLVGGDKLTYNGVQSFGVASSYMDNLATGNHTIEVLTSSGYVSCSFRVGATLKPVDTDKHVIGSSKTLSFVCSDPISRVWVGGTELVNNFDDYYTLSSSGKTITLTAAFLNARTAGSTYTLKVQTIYGDTPTCTFQILTKAQASASPQTGDESNLALWATVLILSGGAMVAVVPRLKKMKSK